MTHAPIPPRSAAGSLLGLRISSVVLALLGLVQAFLGREGFTGGTAMEGHGIVGYTTLAVAVVATIFAWFVARDDASSKGLLWHAGGMAVIAVAQVGLGESGVKDLHMWLGVAFLLGAIALAVLSFRKAGRAPSDAPLDATA